LAREMTDLIHGPLATGEAIRASEILFGGEIEGISEKTFHDIVGEVPTKELERSKLASSMPLIELLVLSGLTPSKGQARKDLEGGGIYANNVRQTDAQRIISTSDLLF